VDSARPKHENPSSSFPFSYDPSARKRSLPISDKTDNPLLVKGNEIDESIIVPLPIPKKESPRRPKSNVEVALHCVFY